MPRRGVSLALLGALFALAPVQPVQSQGWPQKPVRIIVPYAAGGNADIVARIIGQSLSEAFGRQFFLENRTGAAGALASAAVARSPADGYTLLLATLPQIAIVPAVTKTAYDPVKDFSPISNIGGNPYVLAVNPNLPVKSISEFISYAQSQPNKLTYAAVGVASLSHLAAVLFLNRAQLDIIPVMYKGGGAAPVTDLIAGHVPIYFTNLSGVLPHVASGTIRPLAVSSEKRVPQIPDVPTFIESGFPGFKILTWLGLMAPAGTPKEIIESIAREVARGVKDPKIAERLIDSGVDPLGNSPEEFSAQIAADIALWSEAVKISGVQEK